MIVLLLSWRPTWCRITLASSLALVLGLASSVQAGLLKPLDFSSLGTLDLSGGNFTINTDTLTIVDNASPGTPLFTGVADNQGGMASPNVVPEIAVFTFDDINLAASANISIVGTRALALLSQGNASINTNLDVSGGDATDGAFSSGVPGLGGPGGFGGGDQGQTGFGPGGGGVSLSGGLGGSGGFGSDGATGIPHGDDGHSYGNLAGLLQGGSGGGGTYANGNGAAGGGGGGAALEIGAEGTLIIGTTLGNSGSLFANGGAGGIDSSTSGLTKGGDGSGGGIRLHAPLLEINRPIQAKGRREEWIWRGRTRAPLRSVERSVCRRRHFHVRSCGGYRRHRC